jgi:hypothetical protein
MLQIKTSQPMPLHIKKEKTHYNEMNDKISDIDIDIDINMDGCGVARNVTSRFHSIYSTD